MGVKRSQIYFDNPNATYFGGQTVSGRVELEFESEYKVRGIRVLFRGAADTHWTESESYKDYEGKSRTRSVSYDGTESYFYTRYYLIGGEESDTFNIPPGLHVYPFSYVLPPILPSSFEDEYGYIRYTVKVTIDRPWKFDHTLKEAFTVLSPIDLNYNPGLRESATLTMEKYFCCCCCKSGPLSGIFKVPCTGYVNGQVVPFTLEIDNVSDVRVKYAKIYMMKNVNFYSITPSRHSRTTGTKVFELQIDKFVLPKNSDIISRNITVPVLPPSNLNNCNIINISYEIKVKISVDGLHENMYGNLPVTIGTVPLINLIPMPMVPQTRQQNEQTVNSASTIGWIPGPQNESADPNSIPPPSYEECTFGMTKSIMDNDDNKYTRSNSDHYSPSYPVYHFNAVPTAPQCLKDEPSAPLLP